VTWSDLEASVKERSADLEKFEDTALLEERAKRFQAAAQRHSETHRWVSLVAAAAAVVGAAAKSSNEYWVGAATILSLWRTSSGDAKSAEERASDACLSRARAAKTAVREFRWSMTNLVDEAREANANAARRGQISKTIRERHGIERATMGTLVSCPY
jgi:hypothetical protein